MIPTYPPSFREETARPMWKDQRTRKKLLPLKGEAGWGSAAHALGSDGYRYAQPSLQLAEYPRLGQKLVLNSRTAPKVSSSVVSDRVPSLTLAAYSSLTRKVPFLSSELSIVLESGSMITP